MGQIIDLDAPPPMPPSPSFRVISHIRGSQLSCIQDGKLDWERDGRSYCRGQMNANVAEFLSFNPLSVPEEWGAT